MSRENVWITFSSKRISRDIEKSWQKEIQRRVKEIDYGEVECIPWEEVRDRLYGNADAKD